MVIALTCGLITVIHDFIYFNYPASKPTHATREPQDSKNFAHLWTVDLHARLSHPDNWRLGGSGYMAVRARDDQGQVILPVQEMWFLPSPTIKSFDINSGAELWEVDSRILRGLGVIEIDQNGDYIYLLMGSNGFTRDFNMLYVSAIDKKTGQEVWSREIEYFGTILGHAANNEFLSIYGQYNRGTSYTAVTFDASTGKEIPYQKMNTVRRSNGDKYEPLVEELGYEYFTEGTTHKNVIFLLIADDSSIWALDKNSGDVLGHIHFDGSPLDTGRQGNFDMLYSNGYLVLYWADSMQLMSFKFEPPPNAISQSQ